MTKTSQPFLVCLRSLFARAALVLLIAPSSVDAQTRAQAPVVPQYGPHFYALEDISTPGADEDRGERVLRGRTTGQGFAHDSLILAPNTRYREWILQPSTLQVAVAEFTTPAAGLRFSLPEFIVRPTLSTDDDQDGLHGEAEFILGTNSQQADTDGDGIRDGVEIQQGSNPNDGRPVATGVIAAADTPGIAVDVAALNGFVAIADSEAGVAIFDVRGANPILTAQVDTTGIAQRVTWSGNHVVVADGSGGLAIIDAAAGTVVRRVPIGNVTAVAAAAGIAYVGLQSGDVAALDIASGTVLRRLSLGQGIWDLAFGGDYLYALSDSTLFVIAIAGGDLSRVDSVASPFVSSANRRLSIGGGVAYTVHGKGFNTFNLSDPAHPVLITAANNPQFGWEDIVPNGSGLGVAAVGTALAFDQQRVFSLYDLSDPSRVNGIITSYQHPGHARAVSILNGMAYGAAHDAGLQVINYRAFDSLGQPPNITLTADFPFNPAQAEEGKVVRIGAQVTDDVQVRNVEFYINGLLASSDGSFPFEHRFVTPLRDGAVSSFTVQAVAFDTGGNRAETTLVTVQLVPDATPPRLVGQSPERGQIVGSTDTLVAFFNEPVDTSSLHAGTFVLTFAGGDGVIGNGDDSIISGGAMEFRSAINGAFLKFSTALAAGVYRAAVRPPLADLAGNQLARESNWDFLVLGSSDVDLDGVPDNVEPLMGLDPTNPDSDSDGIRDGDEDPDADGLLTAWELAYGFDPRVLDSNGDGLADGQEDRDADALINVREQAARTNPARKDTDADGWFDEAEVSAASDPLVAASVPRLFFMANPEAQFLLPQAIPLVQGRLGTVVAQPEIDVTLPAAVFKGGLAFGPTVAQPEIDIILPVAIFAPGLAFGNTVAQPEIQVTLPAAVFGGSLSIGTVLAQPEIDITVPAAVNLSSGNNGTTLAQPAVDVDFSAP